MLAQPQLRRRCAQRQVLVLVLVHVALLLPVGPPGLLTEGLQRCA